MSIFGIIISLIGAALFFIGSRTIEFKKRYGVSDLETQSDVSPMKTIGFFMVIGGVGLLFFW